MKVLAVIGLLLVTHVHSHAQSNERIQRTWKGPDISAISGLLKEENNGASSKPQSRSNPMRFTPAGDSGVPKALADAFGSSAEHALRWSIQRRKQQMHDWLVCMGGFSLQTYVDAKQNRHEQALATIKNFANYSMRLVFGIEAAKVSLAGSRLTVASPPVTASTSVNHQIVGAWTFAASAQYSGVMRLRYIFNADGTYSFKSERSYQTQKWWTVEENGSYSVNGDSLTITPRTSKATLRNLNGVVQETRESARNSHVQMDHTLL